MVVSGLPAPRGVAGILVQPWSLREPRPRNALVFVDQEGGEVRTLPAPAAGHPSLRVPTGRRGATGRPRDRPGARDRRRRRRSRAGPRRAFRAARLATLRPTRARARLCARARARRDGAVRQALPGPRPGRRVDGREPAGARPANPAGAGGFPRGRGGGCSVRDGRACVLREARDSPRVLLTPRLWTAAPDRLRRRGDHRLRVRFREPLRDLVGGPGPPGRRRPRPLHKRIRRRPGPLSSALPELDEHASPACSTGSQTCLDALDSDTMGCRRRAGRRGSLLS